jgi:hypothetical protein
MLLPHMSTCKKTHVNMQHLFLMTSEEGNDLALVDVGVHACSCPAVDGFQQVDVRDVVCAHHRP